MFLAYRKDWDLCVIYLQLRSEFVKPQIYSISTFYFEHFILTLHFHFNLSTDWRFVKYFDFRAHSAVIPGDSYIALHYTKGIYSIKMYLTIKTSCQHLVK